MVTDIFIGHYQQWRNPSEWTWLSDHSGLTEEMISDFGHIQEEFVRVSWRGAQRENGKGTEEFPGSKAQDQKEV